MARVVIEPSVAKPAVELVSPIASVNEPVASMWLLASPKKRAVMAPPPPVSVCPDRNYLGRYDRTLVQRHVVRKLTAVRHNRHRVLISVNGESVSKVRALEIQYLKTGIDDKVAFGALRIGHSGSIRTVERISTNCRSTSSDSQQISATLALKEDTFSIAKKPPVA